MTSTRSFKTAIAGVGAAALLAGAAQAGDYGKEIVIDDKNPVVPEEDAWTFCDIFSDYNTLYESETGFIRSLSLHGRYHGQYIHQSEDIGGVDNDFEAWQHRRARLAFEVGMAHGLTFFAEANMADNTEIFEGDFFNDWETLTLEWETDNFTLAIGKQKQKFTIEDSESSKRIKTVERSAIANETAGARPWGIVLEFETGPVDHAVGGWLYGSSEGSPQWVDFDSNGGASYNLKYGVVDHTDIRFDYYYADNDGGASGSEGSAAVGYGPDYEHGFSFGTDSEFGKFELAVNGIIALNRSGGGGIPDGNDTWGAYVLASYDITDKLQLVGRYAYMDEGREQRTQRFNVRRAVENYHTIYGGLQYKICGEKLKLMAGYEYATGDIFRSDTDIETGSWQFAIRTYF